MAAGRFVVRGAAGASDRMVVSTGDGSCRKRSPGREECVTLSKKVCVGDTRPAVSIVPARAASTVDHQSTESCLFLFYSQCVYVTF